MSGNRGKKDAPDKQGKSKSNEKTAGSESKPENAGKFEEKELPASLKSDSESKAFKQQDALDKENQTEDTDEQGDYFVESDLESDYIEPGQDFEQWSEGLADEQNLDDASDRDMTELEPLHVVPGGDEDVVEIEDSDSVIGNQPFGESEIEEESAHVCLNQGCHCNVLEGDFCTSTCESVDPSVDDEGRCPCGHSACNSTEELGELGVA